MFKPLTNLFWKNLRRSRLYGFSLLGRNISYIASLFSDSWPGNINFGESMVMGDFPLNGQRFSTNDFLAILEKPQMIDAPMASYLQSFTHLYDLSAISGNAGRKRARQLIEHWIRYNHSWAYMSWNTPAWRPGVVGLRLSAWLGLYDFYASTADDDFKQLLITSFDKQLRYLRRHWHEEKDPLERFWALKGVILGELLCGNQRGHHERLHTFIQALLTLIPNHLLPDGGHISRSPLLHWRFLRDLIDIRNSLPFAQKKNQGASAETRDAKKVSSDNEDALQVYIQKMTPLLRLLRHGDGELAGFQGTLSPFARGICLGVTAESIDSVLTLTDAEITRPPQRAPESGYERCASRNSIFLVNTYPRKTQQSNDDLASEYREPGIGVLNMEWSVGRHRLIHVGDVIMQLHKKPAVGAMADAAWVTGLNSDDMQLLIKRHNKEGHGYIAFDCTYAGDPTSFYWQRHIYMAPKGEELRGQDTFRLPYDCTIAIRFIINPLFSMTGEGDKLCLTLQPKGKAAESKALNKAGRRKGAASDEWLFRSVGSDDVLKSESEGDDRTLLLLKACEANRSYTFKWSFSQTNAV